MGMHKVVSLAKTSTDVRQYHGLRSILLTRYTTLVKGREFSCD